MKDRRPFQSYLLLYAGICVYSFCPVFSKLASRYQIFSPGFIVLYGASLLILAIYALLWQQILRRFPLTTAYSHRPMVTILGMIWGVLIFHEDITVYMLFGAAVMILGIQMVVRADEI